MTTRLLVGDVFERMQELEDHSFDLIVTSPPFLALRSYLPNDHPDKALEIGSETTPADYLDTLLALTAEWRRLLAPHGSIAVELGDTYAGSGGAGGDYGEGGWRGDQEKFAGSALMHRKGKVLRDDGNRLQQGPGWPLDKSLTGIPTLYTWSLAYGRNLLTGQTSPAGRWRVRNLKPWIRSNPPVGALGDKERPATSYITVACTSSSRWFDLDAVRTIANPGRMDEKAMHSPKHLEDARPGTGWAQTGPGSGTWNPGGAPPLDWWHQTDAIIDHVLAVLDGKTQSKKRKRQNGVDLFGVVNDPEDGQATKGTHIRRALTEAGILPRHPDALDVSPKGYAGAHYAVWPPELVRLLVDEMCPRKVCGECGVPSRRIVGEATYVNAKTGTEVSKANWIDGERQSQGAIGRDNGSLRVAPTLGWSDCGHGVWRPGRILDPFSGSGTTLAVASGMGRDSVGIDLDPRNADLTLERVGMFLEVDYGTKEATA